MSKYLDWPTYMHLLQLLLNFYSDFILQQELSRIDSRLNVYNINTSYLRSGSAKELPLLRERFNWEFGENYLKFDTSKTKKMLVNNTPMIV